MESDDNQFLMKVYKMFLLLYKSHWVIMHETIKPSTLKFLVANPYLATANLAPWFRGFSFALKNYDNVFSFKWCIFICIWLLFGYSLYWLKIFWWKLENQFSRNNVFKMALKIFWIDFRVFIPCMEARIFPRFLTDAFF